MNVTRDVITDLLPLYYSKECSRDTKLLVEEYLRTNPDFEEQMELLSQNPFPGSIPQQLNKEDEMKSLTKTQRLLKWRSYVMGFAIFFSLAPFSFLYTQGKLYMLLLESPPIALIYGILGIALWVIYFVIKRRTSDL